MSDQWGTPEPPPGRRRRANPGDAEPDPWRVSGQGGGASDRRRGSDRDDGAPDRWRDPDPGGSSDRWGDSDPGGGSPDRQWDSDRRGGAQPSPEPTEQFGQGWYGYGADGSTPSGYHGPPLKEGNALAVVGLVFAVLFFPLGLILSIVALVRSRSRGGAGKVPGIIGLVLSLVVTGIVVAGVAVVSNSTADDPGCVAAENDLNGIAGKLSADETAFNNDGNNNDTTAAKSDLTVLVGDLQTIQSDLQTAESQAVHPSVKNSIGAMVTDLGTFTSAAQAVATGNSGQATTMETALTSLQSDGNVVDSVCSAL